MQSTRFNDTPACSGSRAASASGRRPQGQTPVLANCHAEAKDSMKPVGDALSANRAPVEASHNLADRVNICRERHQKAQPLAHESDALLGLTAFHNPPITRVGQSVVLDREKHPRIRARPRALLPPARPDEPLVRAMPRQHWGRTLLHETISQGHGTGWPGYRLEWQTFGSIQRRLRACYSGLRAEMPDYGAESSSSSSSSLHGERPASLLNPRCAPLTVSSERCLQPLALKTGAKTGDLGLCDTAFRPVSFACR